ncbi:MAG: ABC transporter permease [Candidatus Marinimicrobia bacterium]|nr:ABC transporter permease [Candidatus Neomarinimicrobiota bacterium]MCF7903599.1 ABC transporter permease [Candidatus Neomarinimicrobiota bacterium]
MIWPVIIKSIKEQIRYYWVLVLTVSLAPFFVFVYYLINEASQPSYDVLILNADQGVTVENTQLNLGNGFITYLDANLKENPDFPLVVTTVGSIELANKKLKAGTADLLLVIPPDLSEFISNEAERLPCFEISGDLSSASYLLSAVLIGDHLNQYLSLTTGKQMLYSVKETPLGKTGQMSEFDMWMPGMMILALIMLMFSATIAIVTEVEQKTITRLKLSAIKSWQLLTGIGFVQVLVGLFSILLTLGAAMLLGFEMQGSFFSFLFIAILTSISMIAFSLLLAAFTRSATEVLIVGNFPLFLFMFFSGAAFPIRPDPWFTIAGYGISWQSLMSPTHAVNALNKISVMGMGLTDVLPEILTLLTITAIYALLGIWTFNNRHLKQSS